MVLIGAGSAAWRWVASNRPSRPNVVLITIDTLRADHLGSYGYAPARTPVLDSLAARGVRFVQAFAHAPLTLPSHASILTGLTPPRHGVRNNPDFVLGKSIPTLAERFRDAGYETAAFVSGFPLHRRFGLARGFRMYDDRFPRGDESSAAPYTERRADQTLEAVRTWWERRSKTEPFLLWVHFFDPHRPYSPPEPFRREFADSPYDGEIAFVDREIGDLLNLVSPAGRNLIVVTADHGEGLGEHGEPTHGLLIYDTTVRVPLILEGTGIPQKAIRDTPARLVDVAPTLLDLTGLPALPAIDGRSLKPAIVGAAALPNEPAYVESLFGRLCCGWAPLSGWRDGQWMYIDAPEPELYDIASDPAEMSNVAGRHPNEVARFQRAVRAAARSRAVSANADTGGVDGAGGNGGGGTGRTGRTDGAAFAALGYFSGSSSVQPSLRNPRTMARLAERMEEAIARERLDPAGAARELRAIVAVDSSNALARRHLAIALSEQHDYEGAIKEINQLRAIGDTSIETSVLLGDCQRLSGHATDAVGTLEAAARQETAQGGASSDVLVALGRALVSAGRIDAGARVFERALQVQPDDGEAMGGLADLALARGDLEEARRRLAALGAADPNDVGVKLKLGSVLARSGDVQAAAGLFQSIVQQDPRNVDALVSLAGALAKAGQPEKAIPYFERGLAAGAVSPVVLNGLAAARLETGDSRGASEALRRSLALRPDQPDVAEMLQRIQRDGGER